MERDNIRPVQFAFRQHLSAEHWLQHVAYEAQISKQLKHHLLMLNIYIIWKITKILVSSVTSKASWTRISCKYRVMDTCQSYVCCLMAWDYLFEKVSTREGSSKALKLRELSSGLDTNRFISPLGGFFDICFFFNFLVSRRRPKNGLSKILTSIVYYKNRELVRKVFISSKTRRKHVFTLSVELKVFLWFSEFNSHRVYIG